jgi:hypothetical protein
MFGSKAQVRNLGYATLMPKPNMAKTPTYNQTQQEVNILVKLLKKGNRTCKYL